MQGNYPNFQLPSRNGIGSKKIKDKNDNWLINLAMVDNITNYINIKLNLNFLNFQIIKIIFFWFKN
jgi:hypothetical protein